jgi:hypothetical protein
MSLQLGGLPYWFIQPRYCGGDDGGNLFSFYFKMLRVRAPDRAHRQTRDHSGEFDMRQKKSGDTDYGRRFESSWCFLFFMCPPPGNFSPAATAPPSFAIRYSGNQINDGTRIAPSGSPDSRK